GIGGNAAIFSLVDALLLRPLPVAEPQRLVIVTESSAVRRGVQWEWNYPVWNEISRRRALFDGAMAWSPTRFNLSSGGPAELIDSIWVSGSFFSVLGVRPTAGRLLTDSDDERGSGEGPVAVVSDHFATRRFGDAAAAIGRTLTLDRVAF